MPGLQALAASAHNRVCGRHRAEGTARARHGRGMRRRRTASRRSERQTDQQEAKRGKRADRKPSATPHPAPHLMRSALPGNTRAASARLSSLPPPMSASSRFQRFTSTVQTSKPAARSAP